ncbi:MAG: hypothetical protein ABIJ56_01260 [Pseudomonadota bacterium]
MQNGSDMDRRLREANRQVLEYLPGAMCSFMLGLTFGMAGGGFAFGWIEGRWPRAILIFPLFGLILSGAFVGFFSAMRRIHGIEISPLTRRRELRAWLMAPPLGMLLGAAAAALYLLLK